MLYFETQIFQPMNILLVGTQSNCFILSAITKFAQYEVRSGRDPIFLLTSKAMENINLSHVAYTNGGSSIRDCDSSSRPSASS